MRAVRLELLGDRVARTAAERACQDRRQGRVDRLRPLYEEALSHSQVVGLAIGTRSDCVSDETLGLVFAGVVELFTDKTGG